MLKKMIFVIIILSLIIVGCAKKKTEEIVKPEESVVITEEQPTDSLEIITEEPVITEEPILEDTNTVQEEYKVQVFATYDEGKANKVADNLKTKINEEIYVEYIAPYYKVRIGHYTTKADAEKVRDSIREIGFSDAFIVLP